ncbi:hypothetical protein [Bordetella bronchiseptica]|uniref:hypothetical protein n=1 Tax=Bordetella bronchiseptica TaxID=518 RepID=UPI0004598915|nr:hypothetical protein [Bordetella bronchiseptica]KCV28575.1 hypothetical protein L489_1332 [Bordetella bronchiseptica 00-P-2730]KAK51913.1 hypothetical protein L576_1224 [Bordetella bronchiseptica OSU054]KCV58025.1 hypothetical protein L492_1220 [Bordetella bronchiseptica 7E71]KDB71729.1 hypothetical protein L494_1219 [Bordetella bronchiseptica CA90 BB1334]KDC14160.1 hypothetical protein AZ20_1133 [Bordetella bronchiseptica E014]
MARESRTTPRAAGRNALGARRFWFVSLAGIVLASGYDILQALQGSGAAAQRLVVPVLLLLWLYRGSDWARWILMVMLLGFGVLNMYLGTGMLRYGVQNWLHIYVFSAFMVATGLYLALAGKDFARYRSHVAARRARRAASQG